MTPKQEPRVAPTARAPVAAAAAAAPILQAVDLVTAAWRVHVLERAGYTAGQAAFLAVHGEVDLHDAVDLLTHGCPAETALRILL